MRALLALAVLAVAVPLSACDGSVTVGGGEDAHQLEVRGAHTAFDVEVPEDWAITDIRETDPCGVAYYRVRGDGESKLVVQAVPTACVDSGEDQEIGNGFHGLYRTVDDVPDPKGVSTITTDLGEATVFTQNYYECTNSCDDWDEPVAIVTVATQEMGQFKSYTVV